MPSARPLVVRRGGRFGRADQLGKKRPPRATLRSWSGASSWMCGPPSPSGPLGLRRPIPRRRRRSGDAGVGRPRATTLVDLAQVPKDCLDPPLLIDPGQPRRQAPIPSRRWETSTSASVPVILVGLIPDSNTASTTSALSSARACTSLSQRPDGDSKRYRARALMGSCCGLGWQGCAHQRCGSQLRRCGSGTTLQRCHS